MSTNHDEAPPSYEEATGNSLQSTEEDMVTNDLPSTSGTASNLDEATGSGSAPEASSTEKSNLTKAEEAGWKSNILPGANTQPTDAPGNSTQATVEDMVTNDLPSTSGTASNVDEASGSVSAPVASSMEKRNLAKAEEAGWKSNILPGVNSQTAGPGSLANSTGVVLPPGLEPLLVLDALLLRGSYERGKGRRYKVTNKNGQVALYAKSIRRGHHHPKDFQLYDSTRTAVVGKLAFTQAADNSMYCNLECPPRISLATMRAQDYTNVSPQEISGAAGESISSQSPMGHSSGVKYTVFDVVGQPVFIVYAPSIMNNPNMQIKVYSAALPGTSVADIWWDIDDTSDGADEVQSVLGEKDERVSKIRIKVTFPLDLDVRMKAALLALCLLKDKIDHRMESGSGSVSEAYRSTVNDVMGSTFGHGRRKHHRK